MLENASRKQRYKNYVKWKLYNLFGVNKLNGIQHIYVNELAEKELD